VGGILIHTLQYIANTVDLTYWGGLPYNQAQPKRGHLKNVGSDGWRPQHEQGGLTSYYTRDSLNKGAPRESSHWTLLSRWSSGITNLCRKTL